MRQPDLIHCPLPSGVKLTLRVIDEFGQKAVPHQIDRMHSERLRQLHKQARLEKAVNLLLRLCVSYPDGSVAAAVVLAARCCWVLLW